MKTVKRLSLTIGLSLLLFNLWGESSTFAVELKIQPAPEGCPECCEVMAPQDAMSADDLMRIKYWMK